MHSVVVGCGWVGGWVVGGCSVQDFGPAKKLVSRGEWVLTQCGHPEQGFLLLSTMRVEPCIFCFVGREVGKRGGPGEGGGRGRGAGKQRTTWGDRGKS